MINQAGNSEIPRPSSKSRKATYVIFITLLLLNIPLYFVTALQGWFSLWEAIILQITWFYAALHALGVNVIVRGDYISAPNLFGWLAISLGTLITFAIYYSLASVIAKLLFGRFHS